MGKFSEELKGLREKRGMSQRDLARASGKAVSDSYISLIEQGKKPVPSRKVVRALAEALGDRSGYLMKLADHDRLPEGAQKTIDRAKKRIERMKNERESERRLSLDSLMVAAEVNQALGASGKTESFVLGSFHVRLFWELFHEGLVDQEMCERFSKAVEKCQGNHGPDWPEGLHTSPFSLVHSLIYEAAPPDYGRAEEILKCIREVYPTLLPEENPAPSTGNQEPPPAREGSENTPGDRECGPSGDGEDDRDLPLSGTSNPPFRPIGG